MIAAHWPEYLPWHPETLRERILALPDELWSTSAPLLLALGSLPPDTAANVFAAVPYLDAADAILAADPALPAELQVRTLLARATAECGLGQFTDAHLHIVGADELLTSADIPLTRRIELRSAVLLQLGICLTLMNRLDEASESIRNGLALWNEEGAPAIVIEALGCLAVVDWFEGSAAAPGAHLSRVRDLADSTLLLALPCASPALLATCLLAMDEDRVDEVERVLEDLLTLAPGTPYELLAKYVDAHVRGVRLGPLEQLDALQEIQITLRMWQGPSLVHYVHDAGRVSALIEIGAISAARDAIATMLAPVNDAHHALCPARLMARLELVTGNFESVLSVTAECRALGDNHAPRSLAQVDALRCVAHDALGDSGTAAEALDRALIVAARTGWRRHLSMLPQDRLRIMLEAARERPQTPETRAALDEVLLGLFPSTVDSLQPLSNRERVILGHIVAGETRRQISAQLCVSQNTIKTQVRSIYRKLGAANRHEAIDRASKYGITV